MRIKVLIFYMLIGYHLNSCKAQKSSPHNEGFVVLELFTSQGCSSCTPADALISEVIKKAENTTENVFVMAYHVDYWDYLGWADKFAQPAFTDRQRKYAKVLGSTSIYTPQIVVNGERHFVGSDRRKLAESLKAEKRKFALVNIELEIAAKENSVDLLIRLEGGFQNSQVQIAVVEKGLSTNILRGENKGKTIRYDNVVQYFQTREGESEILEKLKIPTNIDPDKSEIIVFVQDKNSLEVKGVNRIKMEGKI